MNEWTAKSQYGADLMSAFGTLSLLFALVTLFFEAIGWMRSAAWSPFQLLDAFRLLGISEPSFVGWIGAERVWDYCRHVPLDLAFLSVGLLLITVSRRHSAPDAASPHSRSALGHSHTDPDRFGPF